MSPQFAFFNILLNAVLRTSLGNEILKEFIGLLAKIFNSSFLSSTLKFDQENFPGRKFRYLDRELIEKYFRATVGGTRAPVVAEATAQNSTI